MFCSFYSNYENNQNNQESFYDLSLQKIFISSNIQEQLDFQDMGNNQPLDMFNFNQNENEQLIEENTNKILEDNSSDKTTGEKTGKTDDKILKKVIFSSISNKKTGKKPIEIRVDYGIKNIKTFISKYIKEYGNTLVQNCHFSSLLKNLKLFAPSYPYFTGNANEKDNKAFKNFTVEQILTYPPEIKQNSKKDNRLQKKNKEIIKHFKNYIEDKYPDEKPKEYEELLNFFRMSYEDMIRLFYNNSFQYKEFISSEKSKKFDELFKKIKGYSLIEKNGFLKYLEN